MQQRIIRIVFAALFSCAHALYAYQVQASNFYRPRPKTLRRIARNFHLALAIDKIYTHPHFTKEQQELLKSLPIFVRNTFTPASIIQLRNGQKVSNAELKEGLNQLKLTINSITSVELQAEESANFNKVLKAIDELVNVLDVLSEQSSVVIKNKPLQNNTIG